MYIDLGISPQDFVARHEEKTFLLRRGALRHPGLAREEIEDILFTIDPAAPQLRVHRGGFVPESQYVEQYNDLGSQRRRIRKPAFYDLLKEGATLILNRVDDRHRLIRALCLEISKFASAHAIANGYLAYGNSPSFGKHWDCHDVFAVQLRGRKRWQLYRPTFEQPLSHQTSKNAKADCPEEPELDIVLETGDVLYIPRGWWHCATPIGEETFHVAIGVHPPSVVDYVNWLGTGKFAEQLACRQSLRPGREDHAEKLAAALEPLAEAIRDPRNLERYLATIAELDRVNGPFRLAEAVIGEAPDFGPDSVLQLNTVYPKPIGERVRLNGTEIEPDAVEANLLSELQRRGPARLGELELDGVADADLQPALRRLLVLDAIQIRQA